MKILGIIPARGGSKGIPGKNKRKLLGKPLIQYSIDEALKSSLTDVIVSTDDEEIAEISKRAGAKVISRPSELAQDNCPTLPVLQHAIKSMNCEFDAVMTLQPTSPLRRVIHINESIELFLSHKDADSLVSVVKVPHNFSPGSLMRQNGIWIENYIRGDQILRRQDKPFLWARNGAAIYITRINRIYDYIIGGKILPYEMTRLSSFDIDDMEDWTIIEILLRHGRYT